MTRRRQSARSTACARARASPPERSRPRRSSVETETPASRVVLDASAVLRAYLGDDDGRARGWIVGVLRHEVAALAPELIFAEVANALLVLTRAGEVRPQDARAILAEVVALPIRSLPVRELATAAFATAVVRQLSAYDACYLVAAEAWEAVLVTADRGLAAAAPQSELLV